MHKARKARLEANAPYRSSIIEASYLDAGIKEDTRIPTPKKTLQDANRVQVTATRLRGDLPARVGVVD